MAHDVSFTFDNAPIDVNHGFIWENFHISRENLCDAYNDIRSKEGKKKLDLDQVIYYVDDPLAYRKNNITEKPQYKFDNIAKNKTKEREEERHCFTGQLKNDTDQTAVYQFGQSVSTSETATLELTNTTLVQASVSITVQAMPFGIGGGSEYSLTVSNSTSVSKQKTETRTVDGFANVTIPVLPKTIQAVDVIAKIVDVTYELVFQGAFSGTIIFQDDDDKYHWEDFAKVIKQVSENKNGINYWDKMYATFTADDVLDFYAVAKAS